MKYLRRLAFAAILIVPVAYSHAESTVVKKHSSELRAFQNLDERLASLENYSVVYKEASGEKVVLKSGSGRQSEKKNSEMTVELRPAKNKS